jgi:3D (Asp-Asp-Asp) domain-containing protein
MIKQQTPNLHDRRSSRLAPANLRKLLLIGILIVSTLNLSFLGAERYTATAYALQGRTASGIKVRRGIVAADPRLHRLGSYIHVQAGSYSGKYLVADTGSKVRGRKIDIWVVNRQEAVRFGRRKVLVSKV